MQNINEIQVGFEFNFPYGRGTQTLTVVELPTKRVKSFRVTSDADTETMTISPFQVAKATGLAR